jgi:hypothetical protein
VRVLATRVVAGSMSPMDLAVWAHRRFGHGTLELAERLAELDDAYDCVEYTDMAEHDVDADVIAEARRILAGTPATRPGS